MSNAKASVQLEMRDAADPRRFCTPVTPYQAGFDDGRYGRIYVNPHPVGTPEWCRYDAGHEDARKALKVM